MQLSLAYVSLYQCDSKSTGNVDDGVGNFRGTVAVPYFSNKTTLRQLHDGMAFRLNKYCQAHRCESVEPSSSPSPRKRSRKAGSKSACLSDDLSLNPMSAFYCKHCNDVTNTDSLIPVLSGTTAATAVLQDSDVHLPDAEYAASSVVATVSLYPTVKITYITKRMALSNDATDEDHLIALHQSAANSVPPYVEQDSLLLPRDETTLGDETVHLNLFFEVCLLHELLSQRDDDVLAHVPRVTCDGLTHRVPVARDHCPLFMNESLPLDVSVDIVGRHRVTCRLSSMYSCRDLMIRLEGILHERIARVYDTLTGASVLPCEILGHVLWKLRSRLCAELYPFGDASLQFAPTQQTVDLVLTPFKANAFSRRRTDVSDHGSVIDLSTTDGEASRDDATSTPQLKAERRSNVKQRLRPDHSLNCEYDFLCSDESFGDHRSRRDVDFKDIDLQSSDGNSTYHLQGASSARPHKKRRTDGDGSIHLSSLSRMPESDEGADSLESHLDGIEGDPYHGTTSPAPRQVDEDTSSDFGDDNAVQAEVQVTQPIEYARPMFLDHDVFGEDDDDDER